MPFNNISDWKIVKIYLDFAILYLSLRLSSGNVSFLLSCNTYIFIFIFMQCLHLSLSLSAISLSLTLSSHNIFMFSFIFMQYYSLTFIFNICILSFSLMSLSLPLPSITDFYVSLHKISLSLQLSSCAILISSIFDIFIFNFFFLHVLARQNSLQIVTKYRLWRSRALDRVHTTIHWVVNKITDASHQIVVDSDHKLCVPRLIGGKIRTVEFVNSTTNLR